MRSTIGLRRQVAKACRSARAVFGDAGAVQELCEARDTLLADQGKSPVHAEATDTQRALHDLHELRRKDDETLRREFGAGVQTSAQGPGGRGGQGRSNVALRHRGPLEV